MANDEQLADWQDALNVLRQHKTELREPYLSLILKYEEELVALGIDTSSTVPHPDTSVEERTGTHTPVPLPTGKIVDPMSM